MRRRSTYGKISIGLQLHTVRDQCAKNFVGTLEKIAKMGYKGVELAGTYLLSGAQLKKLCIPEGNGIVNLAK